MKKIYSNPKFKLVILDSNDIVCASDPDSLNFNNSAARGVNAKRRDTIWDEDE